jgi:hypothetical protein
MSEKAKLERRLKLSVAKMIRKEGDLNDTWSETGPAYLTAGHS